MAKISLDLNQFKANGVYTVEYDESEVTVINSQQLRLIVGFSRKGPFNAPVFLKDTKSARKIFGDVDTLLEKRGSFFHRAINTALQTGPVYAINLLPLDNTPTGDKIEYRAFSLSMNEENNDTATALYSSFFNKERFWKPDTEYFKAIVDSKIDSANKLISFTNLGQSPMSIIVRKSKGVTGFDITARDFYGEDNIPEFVEKFAYIKDYFIDIYAVKGDWTDYDNLSIDPDYATYFNKSGLKVDKLDKFLSSDKITMIGSWTGCIIPDFTDKTGTNQYIETIVNNSQQYTGLYMVINRDALEDYENSKYHVDMIGNSLLGDNTLKTLNMLSYVSPVSDVVVCGLGSSKSDGATEIKWNLENQGEYNGDFGGEGFYPFVKSIAYTDNRGKFFNTIVIPKPVAKFKGQEFGVEEYMTLMESLTTNSLIKVAEKTMTRSLVQDDSKWVRVKSVVNTGNSIEITVDPVVDHSSCSLKGTITIKSKNSFDIEMSESTPIALETGSLLYIPSLKGYVKVAAPQMMGRSIEQPIGEYTIETNSEDLFVNEWLITSFDKSLIEKSIEFEANDSIEAYADMMPETVSMEEGISDQIKDLVINYAPSQIVQGDETDEIIVFPGSELYSQIKSKSIINGDKVAVNANLNKFIYLAFEEDVDPSTNLPTYKIKQFADENLVEEPDQYIRFEKDEITGKIKTGTYQPNENPTPKNPFDGIECEDSIAIFSDHATIKEDVEIISVNNAKTIITVSTSNSSKIEVGQYLVAEYRYPDKETKKVLTRVISKVKKTDIETNKSVFEIRVNEPLKIDTKNIDSKVATVVTRYLDINDPNFTTELQFTKLGGFTMTSYHLPNDTDEQLGKILGVIENTNVGKTLADNDIIQFRYIVDTFDGGLNTMMGPKVILSRLAMNKQKCMALLNAPSIKKFTNSVEPRFTEEPDPSNGVPKPVLNCEYIAQGGNLELGPSYTFSFPDEDNGAKYVGVFTPFITIREYNKNKNVPPAADVSNNFIRKINSGNPYSIAAGPNRGIISNSNMVGLEYDFLKEDRGYLEPVGFNCLIDSKQYGPMIYGNATAYQRTLTAFNNLHVRDLLITIENDIEDILSNYVFEFNDAATRLSIRTTVDNYLSGILNAGGIYDYMVVMDESNNTPEVIDQNVGILDIGIEPVRGMQKVINRITVLKTGAISSGGFSIN